jgi:SAM-dependent methyltransferase
MWKEYRAVEQSEQGLMDLAYADRYWTRVWRDKGDPRDAAGSATDPRRLGEWVRLRAEYPAVREHLERLPAGARILDGGCGLGRWVLWWRSQGYEATGLDVSRETVERLNGAVPGNLFVCGDIRETGFPDDTFDAYTSWGTFEHYEDGLGRCFAEARRIVRPGGYLLVSVPFQNRRFIRRSLMPLARWDPHYDGRVGYVTPMRFHQWRLTVEEMRQQCELYGFEVCCARPIHRRAGLHWTLEEDYRLRAGSVGHKLAYAVLKPLVPAGWVAHMLLVVGRKRGGPAAPARHGRGGREEAGMGAS